MRLVVYKNSLIFKSFTLLFLIKVTKHTFGRFIPLIYNQNVSNIDLQFKHLDTFFI